MLRKRQVKVWFAVVILLTIFAVRIQSASAQSGGSFGRYWGIYGSLNYSYWDSLSDVQPINRGGPFETTGWGLELGGYTSVAQAGSVIFLSGFEMGFHGFNYDAIFESEPKLESALEMNTITGSLAFRFGQPGAKYLDIDLGMGWYILDSKYRDCSAMPLEDCLNLEASSSTAGAYVGVTGNLGHGIIMGARIHLIDFGTINEIDLGESSIKGPICSIFLGWEFGNWSRK